MTRASIRYSTIENRFSAYLEEAVWVCWSEIERAGRKVKLPINPLNGKTASVAQPDSWGAYESARLHRRKTGIGLVLTSVRAGHLVGFDLDTCRDPMTGSIDAWALKILATVNSYAEVSPSGAGLKIFALMSDLEWRKAAALLSPSGARLGASWKLPGDNHPPGVELYLGARYFTVTGLENDDRMLSFIPSETVERVIALCAELRATSSSLSRRPASPLRRSQRTSGGDQSESGRAFRVCLAAVRQGVAMAHVPEWAESLASVAGQDRYTVSASYWLKTRGEGTQLMRDYARAEAIVRQHKHL